MSFITRILQVFNGKTEHKKVLHESDIKFSTLIQNIQQNIVEANQSFEYVGIKYIEQFFDKEPQTNKVEQINHKLDALEQELNTGNRQAVNKLIVDLKDDVMGLTSSSGNNAKGEIINYRPKMTSFEIPVLKNGVWETEPLTIPLFALSSMQVLKIKELTFTAKVQNVQHEGDEVYVRFLKNEQASRWRKRKVLTNENVTELKISFNPEHSNEKLNDVITHYEQILRSN